MGVVLDLYNVFNFGALVKLGENEDNEWKQEYVLPNAEKLLAGSFLQEIRGTQILGVLAHDADLKEKIISDLPDIAKLSTKAIDKVSKALVDFGNDGYVHSLGKSVVLIAEFNVKAAELAAANYCGNGSLEIINPMIDVLNQRKDIVVDLSYTLKMAVRESSLTSSIGKPDFHIKVDAINKLRSYVNYQKDNLSLGCSLGL